MSERVPTKEECGLTCHGGSERRSCRCLGPHMCERKAFDFDVTPLSREPAQVRQGPVRTVCMADPIMTGPDAKACTARLEVTAHLPDFERPGDGHHWNEVEVEEFYEQEALKIMDVLDALPRGTRHHLLILLLQAKTEHYRGHDAQDRGALE